MRIYLPKHPSQQLHQLLIKRCTMSKALGAGVLQVLTSFNLEDNIHLSLVPEGDCPILVRETRSVAVREDFFSQ